jgi:hypothetical protein
VGGGSTFDGAPQQSDFGVNQSGSVFDDPAAAVQKSLENCVGIKQGMAAAEYVVETGPLVGELFNGEAEFEDLFAILDSTLNLAVNYIELCEAILAGADLATGDPSGLVGAVAGNWAAMGMTFILELLQPIQDLFGMLTGNPERIRTSKDMWQALANGITPVGASLLQQADRLGEAWQDDGADAARLRIIEGNDVIQVAAALAVGVSGALEFCACVFDKVQGFLMNRAADIVGFLAELVVKALMGPVKWPEIIIGLIPVLTRITLELVQLGMHIARALGALIGLMTGAGEAAGRMAPYLDRMGATA